MNKRNFMDVCEETDKFSFVMGDRKFQWRHEEKATLGVRGDIFVEATRVILNEQFERIDDLTISEINYEQFEQNSPNEIVETQKDLQELLKIETIAYADEFRRKNTKILLKKYFKIWRESAKEIKNKRKTGNVDKNTKIEEFVNNLKNKRSAVAKTDENPAKFENVREKTKHECFKNRFEAQKHIIETQKAQLKEQNKIIEELKLGKIHEDIVKSLEKTKNDLKEAHRKCSLKTKCKKPLLVENTDDSMKFMLNTKKAPKMLQKMQKRAEEREKRHQIILQRKRLIDENKKRQIEEALEKKRAQDEHEKRRNLEIILEKRRQEMEAEKTRKENKRVFLESLKKARDFHKRKLLKGAFGGFLNLLLVAKLNTIKSDEFYERKLKRSVFQWWVFSIEEKYREKNALADSNLRRRLLHKYFKLWKNVWFQTVQSTQVAEDLYDMKLQHKTFTHWHKYVYNENIRREKLMKKAITHYKNRLLFQYFYQWRSLPAVLQLEKAKEEKMKKWRKKVQEILPDYKPPQETLLIC